MSAPKSMDAALPADELALAAGLKGLSNLVSGASTLKQLLREIADCAMMAMLGADGAGITVLVTGHPNTIVASATFVRDLDNIQYRLGEGPCISAAATASTNVSGALAADEAWPEFGRIAADLGIHSALSLPLPLNGQVVGALSVYSHAYDAFDEHAARIGELFAGPAAVAVHNAYVLAEVQQETERLNAAVSNRSMIDRAVGVIMARSGINEDEALLRLRIRSQQQDSRLEDAARRLLEEIVRRVQDRGPRSEN